MELGDRVYILKKDYEDKLSIKSFFVINYSDEKIVVAFTHEDGPLQIHIFDREKVFDDVKDATVLLDKIEGEGQKLFENEKIYNEFEFTH